MVSPAGVAIVVFAVVVLCTLTAVFATALTDSNHGETRQKAVLPSYYDVERYVIDADRVPGLCPNCGAENGVEYNYCSECGESIGRSQKRRTYPDSLDQ